MKVNKLANITDEEFIAFLKFGMKTSEEKRKFYKNKRDVYSTLLRGYNTDTLSIRDLKQGIKNEPEYYREIIKDFRTFNLLKNTL